MSATRTAQLLTNLPLVISAAPASARGKEWRWVALLIAILTTTSCASYQRWTVTDWSVPLSYESDALWGMAASKAVAEGEIVPILPKYPASFGAPFLANWNDYPSSDEGLLAWIGLLTKLAGVFAGANAALVAAHLLAGGAFYFVCRRLRYDPVIAIAAAVLFSFSRYAFSRGQLHLGLVYYWHIPLGILVIWLCVRQAPTIGTHGRMLFCSAVAVLHAIQNPYYTGMFMQLLGLAALCQSARPESRRRAIAPLVLLAITILSFCVMNMDTFYSRVVDGPNPSVVERNYAGLEFYALKPVELLLPVVHRIEPLHQWAREAYFGKTMLKGEAGSPYLGVVGIFALGWLAWVSFRAVARNSRERVPSHAWIVVWIFGYSVVGGVNGIVGFALELFRGTNRYSVFILAVVLLFFVRQLTRFTRNWSAIPRWLLATGIVAIGLFDQIPPRIPPAGAVRRQIMADQEVVTGMEAKLPRGAMVFQLPVVRFPEAGPISGMSDYEHFRPFLHSTTLRYSYGAVKGRSRDAWQAEAEALGVPHLIRRLEEYGFSAVWINRKGFGDRAASVLAAFRAADGGHLLAESDDVYVVALEPSSEPALPAEFANGWHRLELGGDQDWRWSSGTAEIVLHNPTSVPKSVRLLGEIETSEPRRLAISAANALVKKMELRPGEPLALLDEPITLAPGTTRIRLVTDVPGRIGGNGDPRQLAFSLRNFRVSYSP